MESREGRSCNNGNLGGGIESVCVTTTGLQTVSYSLALIGDAMLCLSDLTKPTSMGDASRHTRLIASPYAISMDNKGFDFFKLRSVRIIRIIFRLIRIFFFYNHRQENNFTLKNFCYSCKELEKGTRRII